MIKLLKKHNMLWFVNCSRVVELGELSKSKLQIMKQNIDLTRCTLSTVLS